IVTPKPQTTRGRILGIKTLDRAQIIFFDTPGLHQPRSLINQRMVRVAERAVDEADVVLWVVDAVDGLTPADREIAARLQERARPIAVVLNKIDRLRKSALLPQLGAIAELLPGRDVIPVSARTGANLDELLTHLIRAVPVGPRYYDAGALTDQTERMLVQE